MLTLLHAMLRSSQGNSYLSGNFSNLVQSVHHVVQKLQLLIAQAAEVQWPRSLACLDDAGDVLHKDQYSYSHCTPIFL